MVELPELETLRRELEKETVGKRFRAPEVATASTLERPGSPAELAEVVEGAKVKGVDRRAGSLVMNLDNGAVLALTLGDSARLSKVTPKEAAPAGTAVTLAFTQGGSIRLVDPAGETRVVAAPADELVAAVPATGSVGLDPVADAVSWTAFARVILGRPAKLKASLLDPDVVTGIGPVYSDEILWEAGLRFDRMSDELSSQEIRRLYRGLVETLHEAIKHHGTSLGDDGFVDLYGKPGAYQGELRVYGRDGQPCPRCRAAVSKGRFANRPVYFCASCQV